MASGAKRQPKTFDPPRSKTTKTSKSKPSTSKRKEPASRRSSNANSISSNTSSPAADRPSAARSPSPDFILAELVTEDDTPKIPDKLIITLLNNSFQDKEKTKINAEAARVMGKYVDIFVREAMARSAFARRERESEQGGEGDGFLEVEDLERMGVQMVLDF